MRLKKEGKKKNLCLRNNSLSVFTLKVKAQMTSSFFLSSTCQLSLSNFTPYFFSPCTFFFCVVARLVRTESVPCDINNPLRYTDLHISQTLPKTNKINKVSCRVHLQFGVWLIFFWGGGFSWFRPGDNILSLSFRPGIFCCWSDSWGKFHHMVPNSQCSLLILYLI